MKPLSKSETTVPATNSPAYVWEAPGKDRRIVLTFDVIDRMLQDVMRGFGAVPKRGAEVGGLLLGRAPSAPGNEITIEDYELVPIEYRRGPSYLLSPADQQAFDESFSRLQHGVKDGLIPLGYFRSHTRDSLGLGAEDRELLDFFFSAPAGIALLVRPYATKVSTAGFYVRDKSGKFPEGPPAHEFPFRLKDLGGENFVPPTNVALTAPAIRPQLPAPVQEVAEVAPESDPGNGLRDRWVWLPLSLIFLLLGMLLGYQVAVSFAPRNPGGMGDPYALALAVTKDRENLRLQWNRASMAIQAARGGTLVIDDGSSHRRVDLDQGQLQTGNVVYRRGSNQVAFRLEVEVRNHGGVFESITWTEGK